MNNYPKKVFALGTCKLLRNKTGPLSGLITFPSNTFKYHKEKIAQLTYILSFYIPVCKLITLTIAL